MAPGTGRGAHGIRRFFPLQRFIARKQIYGRECALEVGVQAFAREFQAFSFIASCRLQRVQDSGTLPAAIGKPHAAHRCAPRVRPAASKRNRINCAMLRSMAAYSTFACSVSPMTFATS